MRRWRKCAIVISIMIYEIYTYEIYTYEIYNIKITQVLYYDGIIQTIYSEPK